MSVMSKYQIIVIDGKLAIAFNRGSATLAKVSRKQIVLVLSSVLEFHAAV